MDTKAKLDELLTLVKCRCECRDPEKEDKKACRIILWVLAIVGAITAVACIAYLVYRYLSPAYEDDFYDFDDDFDDFEDDIEDAKDKAEDKKGDAEQKKDDAE